MSLLQVRDCPEDVYRLIAMHAKRNNRTIAQQTIVLLEKGLGQEEPNRERRRRLLESIQSRQVPEAAKTIDAVALIRRDRDR
jgi:hypothetical protein